MHLRSGTTGACCITRLTTTTDSVASCTESRWRERAQFGRPSLVIVFARDQDLLDKRALLHQDQSVSTDPLLRAPGYRYGTVQVFDMVQTHAGVLARGGREGDAHVRLCDVSFVRDFDGNWLEISQRKSLVGTLG